MTAHKNPSFKNSITDHQQVLTRLKEAAHLAYSLTSQTETLVHSLFCTAPQRPLHLDLVFKDFYGCLLVKVCDILSKGMQYS